MRRALRADRPSRLLGGRPRVSGSTTLAAPTEGWDTETPVQELPQTRCRRIENFIPRGVSLEMRRGSADHATGMPASVDTLMAYNAGVTSTLFAASGTAIYNVTGAGAVGAAVVTGLTNARFSSVNFATSGGNFLWVCNGADAPRHWNGTVWALPTLTGVTATSIFWVCESKQRLFFLFNNSMSFGYLPVEQIAGAVSTFNLGSVMSRGGRLVAIGTFTTDGGAGQDDYTAFLSSQGEVAIYAGVNPASATEWSLVGVWFVGEPIGDRPLVELDGDLGVITRNGLVPVAQVMGSNEALEGVRHLTGRIATPYRDSVAVAGALNGWQGLFYPGADWLLINAPTTPPVQYVRHAVTQGWTLFTGMAATCWALFAGRLFFGRADGRVCVADAGYADRGADIVGNIETAWTALGSRGANKRLAAARPIVTTETGAAVAMVARVDYDATPPLPAAPLGTLSNALILGSGQLDVHVLGGIDLGTRQWRSISGVGSVVSMALQAVSRQSRFALNGIDIIYEAGGPI